MRWVETRILVRFNECDPMGVAHHSQYLIWFEQARYALAQEAKVDLRAMARDQIFLPVVRAECEYRQPARFGDTVLARTAILPPRAARLEFQYELLRLPGRTLLARGRTVHAVTKPEGGIFMQLPANLRTRIEEFLAG